MRITVRARNVTSRFSARYNEPSRRTSRFGGFFLFWRRRVACDSMWRLCFSIVLFVLVAAHCPAAETKTLLLVGQSRDNHPPTTHEFMAGVEFLAKQLESTDGLKLQVVKADGAWAEGPALIQQADGVVLFLTEGARWVTADPRRHDALAQLAARGGGLVALHWAIGTRDAAPIAPFLKLFGGCHGGPDRKYQVVETEVRPADASHPITDGLQSFRVRDEFYYQLKFEPEPAAIRPVLLATIDGGPQTVAWSWQRGDGGRSFGFSGLHFDANWQIQEYRQVVTRGVLWTLDLLPK